MIDDEQAAPLWCQLDLAGFDAPAHDLRPMFDEVASRELVGTCLAVRANDPDRILAAGLLKRMLTHVLILGFAARDRARRSELVARLRAVTAGLPSVALARIDAFPRFANTLASPLDVGKVVQVADHYLPEPAQLVLLGPEHLRRLGTTKGVSTLPDGKAWLEVRSPIDPVADESEYELIAERARAARSAVDPQAEVG